MYLKVGGGSVYEVGGGVCLEGGGGVFLEVGRGVCLEGEVSGSGRGHHPCWKKMEDGDTIPVGKNVEEGGTIPAGCCSARL